MIRGEGGGAAGAGPSRRLGVGQCPGKEKKKMVIRPFKVQPKLPENFEDETWEKLRAATIAVQTKQASDMSREELYRAVEDLVVHKMGARLYERLHEECARHVASVVASLENQTTDSTLFLSRVDDVWQDHCDNMLTIRSVFLYLDRSFVMQAPNLLPIWELGLKLFRDNLAGKGHLEHKTVRGLLGLIERERNGEAVNRALIRSLVRMLSALGVYKSAFQRPFLEDTERYFAAEGEAKMESLDVVAFLLHVEARLREASESVVSYLEPATRRPLMTAIEQRLLAPHVTALIERGFDPLMDQNRAEDLQRMYSLSSRKEKGVEEMKAAFNAYLRKRGAEVVQDEAREKEMVESLLAFKAKADALLEKAFARNELFVYSLKDAFEYVLNVRQNRPAELLAKFVDGKLKGEKGASDDDVEALLERVMVLFRYVGSKDVFEAFYKKDLAKRLLLGRSASSDLEKSMIAKLKAECGATFTNKLEGMFKDMDLSREIMNAYAQHLESKRAGERRDRLEMTVQVLTTGYWPAYPPMDVVVPPVLQEHMQRFTEYYTIKYQGRRLEWQHLLGQCVVKARFPLGVKELSVSFFQTLVLLCFADGAEAVDFKEIKARTNVEDGELRRTLQSLACGKVNQRVLQKEPKGKDVGDGDVFHLNKDFTHKLYRIRINTIQLKETVEENEKTHEAVFRDRQYQVDAAIVRIMKVRKKLSHTLLMSELLGQLKFPAKPLDLKKRIESLIEREYLERDSTNSQVYNYLA